MATQKCRCCNFTSNILIDMMGHSTNAEASCLPITSPRTVCIVLHFRCNESSQSMLSAGEPYRVGAAVTTVYICMLILISQYVGGTADTVPFDGAPSAVVKARDLIQSRMTSVLQAESQPYRFNEVLSAAYMEKQSMAVSIMLPVLSHASP